MVDSGGSERTGRTISRRAFNRAAIGVVVGGVATAVFGRNAIQDTDARIRKELNETLPKGPPSHIRENSTIPNVTPSYLLDAKGDKVPYVYDVELDFSQDKPFVIRERANPSSEPVSQGDLQKAGIQIEDGITVSGVKWEGAMYASGHDGYGDRGYWVQVLDQNTGETVGYVQETNASYKAETQRTKPDFLKTVSSNKDLLQR